jgi:DNA invertase Pin-like site-specific DNA recombinase
VLAAAAQLERDHLADKSRAAARAAAERGVVGGRPRVLDDAMLRLARTLRGQGVPVPQIAQRLTITTGRSAGRHPSVASVYRALAEPAPTPPPTTHRERIAIEHDMD